MAENKAEGSIPREQNSREERLERLGQRLKELEALMQKAEGSPGVPGDDEALRKAEALLDLDDEFLLEAEKVIEGFHEKYGGGDDGEKPETPKPTEPTPPHGSAS